MDDRQSTVVSKSSDWTARYFWRISLAATGVVFGYFYNLYCSIFVSPNLFEVVSRRFCLATVSAFTVGFLTGYFFDRYGRVRQGARFSKPVQYLWEKGWTGRFVGAFWGLLLGWFFALALAAYSWMDADYVSLLLGAIWSTFGAPVCLLFGALMGFLPESHADKSRPEQED